MGSWQSVPSGRRADDGRAMKGWAGEGQAFAPNLRSAANIAGTLTTAGSRSPPDVLEGEEGEQSRDREGEEDEKERQVLGRRVEEVAVVLDGHWPYQRRQMKYCRWAYVRPFWGLGVEEVCSFLKQGPVEVVACRPAYSFVPLEHSSL